MANYQIPANLIDQVQILLRKEALLESFNPNDPSLPSPPTIQEALAGINQSLDLLRCKHCGGALQRGVESIICVYCGGYDPHQEPLPQPIPFKSTLGFGWLLQSLGLDASESVAPPIGHTQLNKGQGSFKNEILLSDVLDLELKWTEDSKRDSVKNEAQLPGNRYLNLVGVDFDELFAEGGKEHASRIYKEQAVVSENIEDKETTFPGRSLNLFKNIDSSEVALRSDHSDFDESSAWEAEFQSAIPDTEHEHLQSFDVSKLSSVEFVSHIDSEVGPAEPKKSAEISISHVSSGSNLTSRDLSSNTGPPYHFKQYEGRLVGEVAEEVSGPVNTSSFDWPLEDVQKNTSAGLPDDKKIHADDLTDKWKKFEAVTGSENNKIEPSYINGIGGQDIPDAWNAFTGSVGVKPNQLRRDNFEVPSDDTLSTWNNFASATKAEAIQSETTSTDFCQSDTHHGIGDPMLGENDFSLLSCTHQDQLQVPAKTSPNKTCDQADQIASWGSHICSTVQNDQLQRQGTKSPASSTVEEIGDSLDFWDDFKSSGIERQQEANDIIKFTDNKLSSVDDSTIDAWSDTANLGAKKKEHEINNAMAADSNRIDSHGDSFASWDGNFDAWNNILGSTGVSDNKPVGTDNPSGAWNGFSSTTVSQAGQHQGSGTQMAENQIVLEDGGLSNSWSDFRSSGTEVENSFLSSDVSKSNQGEISVRKPPEYDSPFNSWGDFGPSTSISKMQSQGAGTEFSDKKMNGVDDDFFYEWGQSEKKCAIPPDDEFNSIGVTVDDCTLTSVNDDALANFTSSSNVQANSSASNPTNAVDDREVVKRDDPFDTWNVFVTSPRVQAHSDAALAKASKFTSPIANSQGLGSSSSVQPDLFLGVLDDQHSSQVATARAPEVPGFFRMENDLKAENFAEVVNQSENTSMKTSDGKLSDVETLISEMHDLSFMLESSLTIPESSD